MSKSAGKVFVFGFLTLVFGAALGVITYFSSNHLLVAQEYRGEQVIAIVEISGQISKVLLMTGVGLFLGGIYLKTRKSS